MAQNFSAAQIQALMAQSGVQQPAPALTFKAGICTQATKDSKCMVTADPRRGTVKLINQDGVLHLIWSLRPSDVTELDLMLFRGSCSFERVSDCTDGRVYLLKMTDNGARHWFWMQEADAKKDKEVEEQFNKLLKDDNMTSSTSSAARAPVTPARPTPVSTTAPAATNPPSAAPSTQSTTQPAAAPGADANALARALAAMQVAQANNQPRYHLNDVLDAERVLACLDQSDLDQLMSELPENDRDVGSHLRSAQFLQTVQRLNNLLYGQNYGSLMSSLGLPVDGFGVEGLVQALQQRASQQSTSQSSTQSAQAPSTPNQPTQPHNKEPERK